MSHLNHQTETRVRRLTSCRLSVSRFQGADLRRVPLPAPRHAGGPDQCHAAARDPGDDQQVHDRPDPHPRQTVSLMRIGFLAEMWS